MADLLPNPMARRTLPKASRTTHPGEREADAAAGESALPTPVRPGSSSNRVGPNRVRKSLYLPTDAATALEAEVNRIHHSSQGRVSKADAAGAIIRAGLDHLNDVNQALQL